MRGGRGGAIGGTDAGVVLGATPGKADTRVTDRVTLHLIDCHFRSVAVDKLNETASLAGRDLDVGDFAESLEERAELVLGDVAGEAADENSRVVRVGKLVHRLHGVEAGIVGLGRNSPLHVGRMGGNGRHHCVGGVRSMSAVLVSSAKKC